MCTRMLFEEMGMCAKIEGGLLVLQRNVVHSQGEGDVGRVGSNCLDGRFVAVVVMLLQYLILGSVTEDCGEKNQDLCKISTSMYGTACFDSTTVWLAVLGSLSKCGCPFLH